jgi:succinoglycan biosynthesis protein ExoA
MKISAIIPCRNEKRHIGKFLDSLLSQDLEPGWELEILVADGMSDDGTREILRAYAAKTGSVRMIDNPDRIVSTGLNAAIRESTGQIIVRMDAHTVYARDYIRECVRTLQDSGADNVGGPWVAVGHGFMGRAIAAAFRSPFCTGGGKAHDPNYEGDVDTVYLGCWRRAAFERWGLFDPELVRNQDDEFNFRIRRQGGRIHQSPSIRSTYTPRASLAALFRQYLQYGFWRVSVIRKHRALASWRHTIPMLFVSSILGLFSLVALAEVFHIAALAAVMETLLGVELLAYALFCVGVALPYLGSLDLPALLVLPVVVAAYHTGYGLGFLLGILRPVRGGKDVNSSSELFTALTR